MFNASRVMDLMQENTKMKSQVIELQKELNKAKNHSFFTCEELDILEEMIKIFYAADEPSKESILLSIDNCRNK